MHVFSSQHSKTIFKQLNRQCAGTTEFYSTLHVSTFTANIKGNNARQINNKYLVDCCIQFIKTVIGLYEVPLPD